MPDSGRTAAATLWLGTFALVVAVALTTAVLTGCARRRSVPNVPPPPSEQAANFVFRPAFALAGGREIVAGTAFAARVNGKAPPMLLSALHLFGPAGGLRVQMRPARLPNEVQSVALLTMDNSHQLGLAGRALLRDGYPLSLNGDCSGDIVAFALPRDTPALTLAPADPTINTRVWVMGQAVGDNGPTPRLYRGVVRDVKPTALTVVMDRKHDQTGMSGAPVVNRQGQVVGMLIGGGEVLGKTAALCNPVSAMRRRLAAAR